jgi:hypothetical protein
MYNAESEAFMVRAGEHACIFPSNYLEWNPALDRFFPTYRQKLPYWDICGYLYHVHYVSQGVYCPACHYGYSGHREGIERGRLLWNSRSSQS